MNQFQASAPSAMNQCDIISPWHEPIFNAAHCPAMFNLSLSSPWITVRHLVQTLIYDVHLPVFYKPIFCHHMQSKTDNLHNINSLLLNLEAKKKQKKLWKAIINCNKEKHVPDFQSISITKIGLLGMEHSLNKSWAYTVTALQYCPLNSVSWIIKLIWNQLVRPGLQIKLA